MLDSGPVAARMVRWMRCVGIHGKKVSFIVDADIRSFFDTIRTYLKIV